MKKMGRLHRPYYRICAIDSRNPRDGRVLEQLGTYDPMIPETDARATLNVERVKYWLSVGALPSEKVEVLLKKYGPEGTHLEKQKEAIDRLAQTRRRPTPPPRPVQAAAAEASAPAPPPAGETTAE
jgi:small subunit ribosomal protein S16